MGLIRFKCKACGQTIKRDEIEIGHRGECLRCQTIYAVPPMSDPTAMDAPPPIPAASQPVGTSPVIITPPTKRSFNRPDVTRLVTLSVVAIVVLGIVMARLIPTNNSISPSPSNFNPPLVQQQQPAATPPVVLPNYSGIYSTPSQNPPVQYQYQSPAVATPPPQYQPQAAAPPRPVFLTALPSSSIFPSRNVSIKTDDDSREIIGEITDESGRDYEMALFSISLYDANGRLVEVVKTGVTNLHKGETKSFDEIVESADPVSTYKLQFDEGN
jgi:hypothetical protein